MFTREKTLAYALAGAALVAAMLSYAAWSGRLAQDAGGRDGGGVRSAGSGGASELSQGWAAVGRRGATPDPGRGKRGRMPSLEAQISGDHVQARTFDVSQRLPRQPQPVRARNDYDHGAGQYDPLARPSFQRRMKQGMTLAQAAAAATCDPNAFQSLSGSALVASVKAATPDCINQLFGLTGTAAYYTFREAQMVTVANALNASAASYDGTNSGSTLQLVLFLRAGYYVQYYAPSTVGAYGAPLKSAVVPALDAFYNNGNFGLVNDAHGETLSEYVTLIDSAGENAHMLPAIKRLLSNYNSSWNGSYWMKAAVNNVFTVMFRGHQNADFRTLVQSDNSIVDALYGFANNNFALLGTDNDYLATNAGREAARFLQYTGTLKSLASSRTKALLDRSSITGTTAPMWVGLGDMVQYYDAANCSYYGTCDFSARVSAAALPISYTCSSTLKLRAQSMAASELTWACNRVAGEETYFHTRLATGNKAVGSDNNAALEMVVFNSSKDYGTYAGAIFGIDTNNGGMYLEGDPSAAGNQARFIAYEAEWMLPTFDIWNLTHEYIHYLDGRFDMYGDFTASTAKKTVWWIEGLAEYMSYSYRNLDYTEAQTEAGKASYALSGVFANDYNSGTTLVYRWGYLAVRYMFEKRPAQVTSILGYFRPGNYTGYETFMTGIGTQYDADFKAWLPCVSNPNGAGCSTPPPTDTALTNGVAKTGLSAATGGTLSFVMDVPAGATNLKFAMSGGTGDADMYVRYGSAPTTTVYDCRPYVGGNTETCTYTTVQAGRYYVMLSGYSAFSGVSLTGSYTAATGNAPPTASFTATTSGLTATFVDGSTDSDGSIASRAWDFGDGTTSTATNPSRTYSAAGTYTVKLTVVDNKGASATVSKTVTVSATTIPECSAARTDELGRNCSRSNVSATQGNYAYFYLPVPAGVTQLRITSSGGTGNADLYYSGSTWATTTNATASSKNAGNGESLTINAPPSGYVFVSLYGVTAFSGVKLTVQY